MKTCVRVWNVIALFLLALGGAWAQSSPSFGPAYQTLTTSNVYVDPALKAQVSQQMLEQAALQGQDNPHTIIKIAVLADLPPGFQDRNQYAAELHQLLGLTKNGLVVVVANGRAGGVSVEADELDTLERSRLAQQYVGQITSDPTAGTAALAEAAAGAINNHEYRSSIILWIIFFVIAGIITAVLMSASRQKKKQLSTVRQPVEELGDHVLSGIEYVDHYVDVLPKNNPESDQVRAFRQSASTKYEQAEKILKNGTEQSDLLRAQGLLDRAQADVEQAQRYLNRAIGDTKNIPGDEAFRPKPLPVTQAEVEAIPANQRGVSFFSSQPAPLGSLVPVTVTIGGQSRQVLATPAEADELRQGRMPQVRSFQVGGRMTPWYAYQQYDPYQNYWQYQNAGWSGFGSGLLAGWIGAELIDDLMMPSYAGGYAPYAFTPDAGYSADAPGQYGDFNNYAGGGLDTPDANAGNDWGGGGADFNNGGNDNTDWGNSGLDTSDASADNDWGGGSADFGGTDFSSGGDDFGGGDFGGNF